MKQLAAAVAAGLVGGALALAGPGLAYEPPLSIGIEGDCESVTVTFVNPTKFAFAGDIRIDGAAGTPDKWSEELISQGPLAGEAFGDRYDSVPLPAGETTTQVLDFPAGSGERLVQAVVRRGPEQKWYVPWHELAVDCGQPDDDEDEDEGDDGAGGDQGEDGAEGDELTCVDVNTADLETLQLLKHVGEVRAAQIIELRPFVSIDDLARVDGLAVGGKNLAELVAGGGEYLPLCEFSSGSGGDGEQAGDQLPSTGSVTGLVAGGAGALLAAGAGCYLAARRRRVTFTA